MNVPLHEITMKDIYGQTLVELGEKDSRIVVVDADLTGASGSTPFRDRFPERYVNVGVAEANMICVAAGLAADGKIPFCCSFTPFATRRVYDQITISIAFANNGVNIVGIAPGITTGMNGGTHMCFQDLAIMRAMPNMAVLSPADAYELRACMYWMASSQSPAYMQLIRSKQKPLRVGDRQFQLGRAVVLHEGSDVTLVSTGYMTQFALTAAEWLEEEGIGVDLLHCPCIKPFPADDLLLSAHKTNAVVTVENQSTIGGLGGATAEMLSEAYPVPVKRLGIPDVFGEVVLDDTYILEKYSFGSRHIADACRELARHQNRASRIA